MKNTLAESKFTCPCCGFAELKRRPYANMPNPPFNLDLVSPPYEKTWGPASYSVCSCCGFEFGFDDNTGISIHSFAECLKEWIEEGCKWFEPEKKPDNWSLENQLLHAGIKLPKGIDPEVVKKATQPKKD